MEDELANVTSRNRISHPFNTGVDVIVVPGATTLAGNQGFVGHGRRFATVHLFHRNLSSSTSPALPVLKILARIAERVVPGRQVGDNTMSWLLKDRAEQRWRGPERVFSEIVVANQTRFRELVSKLPTVTSVQHVLEFRFLGVLLAALSDADFPLDDRPDIACNVLRLPWRLLRYSPGLKLLRFIRRSALGATDSSGKAQRGYALELAVAADQLLQTPLPRQRFVFLGTTLLGKDGLPANEWDIVRLDIGSAGSWTLTATECAIARSNAKDAEARDKLDHLRQLLDSRFSDLAAYRTLLATATSGGIEYVDAGRSWADVSSPH